MNRTIALNAAEEIMRLCRTRNADGSFETDDDNCLSETADIIIEAAEKLNGIQD